MRRMSRSPHTAISMATLLLLVVGASASPSPVSAQVPDRAPVSVSAPASVVAATPAPARAVGTLAPRSAVAVAEQQVTPRHRIRARRLATVLQLVNRARSQPRSCGGERFAAAPPLRRTTRLNRAANRYARLMARRDFLSHDGPGGTDAGQRMAAAGYRWSRWGENLAGGFNRPADVVAAWLDSPSHCRNIMGRFSQIGLGRAYSRGSTYGTYWVQNFASPR
jgi:uncharacterized protein YkwD